MHGSFFACGCCEHHPPRNTTTLSSEPPEPIRVSPTSPAYTRCRSAQPCSHWAKLARTASSVGSPAGVASQDGAVCGQSRFRWYAMVGRGQDSTFPVAESAVRT